MEKVPLDPDTHLASFPAATRETMQELDRLITAAFPGRSRVVWVGKLWGGTDQHIIGYGDLIQARPRGDDVEWFAVGLARQKQHYSLYVNAIEDGHYLLDTYADRLGKVKIGAASIGFKTLADLNLDALNELLRRTDQLTRDQD